MAALVCSISTRNVGLIRVEEESSAGGRPTRRSDGGDACRRMGKCVNPPATASPLWIRVLLNFSKGGRRGTIGHSVNVSESEQRQAWQPRAVACHSLCPAAVYFLIASPHRLCPAPFHLSIIVFYLHLTVAQRKIAHPLIDMGYMRHFFSLNLSPSEPESTNIYSSHITHFHWPSRIPSPQLRLSLIYHPTLLFL